MAPPDDRDILGEDYRKALREFVADGSERPLHQAYEIGRGALQCGFSMLDLINLHHHSARTLLQEQPQFGGETLQKLERTERFLVECLSPFEVLQLGNREAIAALQRLNAILEEEAKRIAHVLHDEAAQLLAAVYLELAELQRDAPASEAVRTRAARITAHLDQVRAQLRRLSHELRPPILDNLGLLPALEFLADGYRKRTGLHITVAGVLPGRLPAEVETTFYRVVQEALANVSRHAHAQHVEIRIRRISGQVRCTISDDGVGFDHNWLWHRTDGKGLGLLGIQERVNALHGTFDIRSRPGSGTRLAISIPNRKQ